MSDPARPHAPSAHADVHGSAVSHGHDHDHHHAAGGEHDHAHEVHDASHYVKIWAILIVLFLISVGGPLLGHPIVTLITAFGIAVVKASMVIKYFMHLDVEKRIVHYFLATALVFMFLFFAAVAPDVMKHSGTHWENISAQEAVQKGMAEGSGHDEHGAAPHGEAPAGEHNGGGH